MKCPTDNSDLQEKQGEGFTYHECSECEGLWMRFRALRTLVEKHNPNAFVDLPHPERLIPIVHSKKYDTNNITKCPLDGDDYFEHRYGTVMIDICPTCDGIWLDQGELAKIKEELKDGTTPDTVVETVLDDFGVYDLGRYFAGIFSSDNNDEKND